MRSWWLAVDFGTIFTTAAHRPVPDVSSTGAAMSPGAAAEVLEFDASRYLPSAVFLDDDGSLLVGRHALSRGAVFPERLELWPKRALAAADHVRLGGMTVPVADLVAAVLRSVADEARRRHNGSDPDMVTLTHPARWGERELSLLALAAKQVDLPDPAFVPEPVAAACHYVTVHQDEAASGTGRRPGSEGTRVAVYDLGGGTLDTAVLCAHAGGFALAGPPGGATDLGGTDLDHALRTVVARHAESLDAAAWNTIWSAADHDARRARERWRTEIVRSRELLSDHPTTTLHESGFESGIRLTRGEFDAAVEPLLRRSVRELAATIGRAGLVPADITAVYLAGGASRTPLVSTLIHEEIGILPTTAGDPKAAVVLGALEARAASASSAAVPPARPAPWPSPLRGPVGDQRAPQPIPPQPASQAAASPPAAAAPGAAAPVPGARHADTPAPAPGAPSGIGRSHPPRATAPEADIPDILRTVERDSTAAAADGGGPGRLPRRPSRRSLFIALLLGWWAVIGGYSEYYQKGGPGLGGFSGGLVFCCLVVIAVSRAVVSRRTVKRRPRRFP